MKTVVCALKTLWPSAGNWHSKTHNPINPLAAEAADLRPSPCVFIKLLTRQDRYSILSLTITLTLIILSRPAGQILPAHMETALSYRPIQHTDFLHIWAANTWEESLSSLYISARYRVSRTRNSFGKEMDTWEEIKQ